MKTSRNVRFVALFGTVAAFVIAIAIAAFGGPQIDASTTAPVGQPHDRWYVETRNQPVQRDRWYVEAKMQPAARDQWYIESKARPAATDKWYLDMPGAREHTILTSTTRDRWYTETKAQPVGDRSTDYRADRAYFHALGINMAASAVQSDTHQREMNRLRDLNEASAPALSAQPTSGDRWYLDMPGAREHTILTSTAARDRWYTEAKAQPAARDRWYLDMPNTRKSFI